MTAHYRDQIARRVAEELLAPYAVAVDAVSVNSIDAERLDLDAILLLHDNGGRIRIEGLSIPVAASGLAGLEVTVQRVAILLPGRDPASAGSLDVVGILDRLIPLPSLLPGMRVAVSDLRVDDYVEATDVVWESSETRQTLEARIDDYRLEAALTHVDTGRATARLSVATADVPDAVELTLRLARGPDGYVIDGPFSAIVAPLLPVLVQSGVAPAALTRVDASFDGIASVIASERGDSALRASVSLAPGEPARLAYRSADGTVATLEALDAAAIELEFGYPALDWQFSNPAVRLQVDSGPVQDVKLGLRDIVCRRGTRCTLGAEIEPMTLDVGIGLTGSVSDMEVSIDVDGWRARIGEASIDVGGITGPGELEAALTIHPRSVILDGPDTLSGELSIPGTALSLLGYDLAIPASEGTFTRDADDVALMLRFGDGAGGVAADVVAEYDLASGETQLTFDDARVDFAVQALSELVGGWDRDWDLVAGSWTGRGTLLQRSDGSVEITANQSLDAIAGRYRDIAFAGLSTTLSVAEADWPPAGPHSATLSADLIEVGFPLRDFEAELSVDPATRRVTVERAGIDALGGRVAVDPFVFDPASESFAVTLRPAGVQLPLIADLASLTALDVTGSVSGTLPLSFGAGGVTVEGGRLSGDPPGGTIRYAVSGCTEEVMRARSGLEFARCVLTYYEFDGLNADVSYGGEGNLVIEMRLTGVNPEYDPEQPVNLNPTLTTNVADLVRSLQAARSIEEALNRQAQR